jgi:uncharacterized protein with HEPN domain
MATNSPEPSFQDSVDAIEQTSIKIRDVNLDQIQTNISWRKVAGIGSIGRHDYENVSADALWKLATDDLAPLEAVCRDELADENTRERK